MIQTQFLNKLISTKNASLLTINNLNYEFFSDYVNEYKFIQAHLNQYGTIPDIETFVNKFPDFDIINVTESDKYLLDALYEDRNKRIIAKTFNQVRDCLTKGDVDEAMRLYNASQKQLLSAKHISCTDLYKDLTRYDEFVERSQNINQYYVKTGFSELDEVTGGWDRKEELAVVTARTNNGKSFITTKMAAAAAEQGLNVLIFNGEMSTSKVGYRLDTLLSHISNTQLIRGNIGAQVNYKKFLEDVQTNLKGSIKLMTAKDVEGPITVSTLEAFIEREKGDILFVDQYSLMEDQQRGKTQTERFANISKDLKLLQTKKQIPIIAVSQLNRQKDESGEDIIDTTMLSMSDRIAQDATTIIGISRDKKDKKLMKLQIVKARDTEVGKKLSYIADFDKGIFTFIPEENDATDGAKCEGLKDEYEYEDDSEAYGDQFA